MISDSITAAFRKGVLEHILNSRPKIALYTKSASLDAGTERYTPENEVIGDGYQSGGLELGKGVILSTPEGDYALVFHSPVWSSATVKARGALIYTADDQGRAIRVIDFGKEIVSTNGPFTVKLAGAAEGGILAI